MIRQLSCLVLGAAVSVAFCGCGGDSKPVADDHSKKSDEHKPGDGHDHSGEAHAEEGPHHGHLIELGKEEYHAELTHDEATHTVTIYMLDSSAKKSVPIEAKELLLNLTVGSKGTQFKLPALPQESDPEGMASRFQLAEEALCDGLDAKDAKGRINVDIAGKSYAGAIEHSAHGEHKH